ncbi:GGDEF domain-containing protein [Vibrio jasicida]|uniref:GGDEF domain-containing protein n=1 Tax=Vibrio jasicida TaxID=766224 RepID=UPI000CE51060|nr:GGDEF domain-containing protein [Vibrio jasicida]
MLLFKLSKNSLVISFCLYIVVVSVMSVWAINRSEKEFASIANYLELYKSTAILTGLRIESDLKNQSDVNFTQQQIESSQRVKSLNDAELTPNERIAFSALDDLFRYNRELTERPNVHIYYRSYEGKKLIFSKANDDLAIDASMFDPMLCSQTRSCTLNMHDSDLADRVIFSENFNNTETGETAFSISSPVYLNGQILGDVVVEVYVNYHFLDGQSLTSEKVNGHYYVTIGHDKYPFYELTGGLVLPLDNTSVVIYQLPVVKVLIDNLWVLLVAWGLVRTYHRLYSSNIRHQNHLAHAIKNASKDELTSLHNRKVFEDEEFEQVIKQGHYSVILIDGDKFKEINDNHGHNAGDMALIHIARTMQSTFRQSDWLIRLGGDEFVAVIPSCSLESAENLALRLKENIVAKPLDRYNVEVKVTTGVAKATGNKSLIDVLELADRDMYRSK